MVFRIQPHMRLHEWVAGHGKRYGLAYSAYRWMQDRDLVDPAQERARYDETVLG